MALSMWSQLAIVVSLALASISDIKERAVHDSVWIPALAGIIYSLLVERNLILELLPRILIIAAVALAFTVKGLLGHADGIALAIIAFDPYYLSTLIIFVSAAAIALTHISLLYFSGRLNSNKITVERFVKEQCWIPKAVINDGIRSEVSKDVNKAREEAIKIAKEGSTVEVIYGVPTVTYIGFGYIAYVLFLVLFNYSVFASLP